MEYEDGGAKEKKDSGDLQLDNNLDNGQELKVLLMIHIFLYIYVFSMWLRQRLMTYSAY